MLKERFFGNYTNLSLICNALATPVNVPYSGFNGLALLMGHVKFHKSHWSIDKSNSRIQINLGLGKNTDSPIKNFIWKILILLPKNHKINVLPYAYYSVACKKKYPNIQRDWCSPTQNKWLRIKVENKLPVWISLKCYIFTALFWCCI